MKTPLVLQSRNMFWMILLLGHFFLLILLYKHFGLNVLNEGDKYLTAAEELTKGNFQKAFGYKFFYSAYIVYLSFFKLFKLPVITIFICNYILTLAANYFFYQFISEKIDNINAKVWLSFMLLSPLIQFWQFNLFSESFFIAINLIFIYVLFYSKVKQRYLKLLLLSVVILLSRPSGIFSILAFLLLYCLLNNLITKKTALISLTFIGIVLFTTITFFVPLHYRGYCKDITMGSIYCGFPSYSQPILPKADYTLWQCYQYLYEQHGFGSIVLLFVKKIDSFFVLSRPYYTSAHNLINLLHYLFYVLGLYGLWMSLKHKNFEAKIHLTILAIILLNALLIGLFFNEWSERYTVVVFPFIFLLASAGFINLYQTLKTKIAI